MAHMLNTEGFEKLRDMARPLLDAARELSLVETVPAPGLDETAAAVLFEAEAFGLAMQAIAAETALDEQAIFIAMGGAVATILAQCQTNHALLLKRMRDQEKASYDEVQTATKPAGRMQ